MTAINFHILRFDSLASTNTEAARQAERGAAEGLCIVAREQRAGRGRLGRAWSSPLDAGLYFSIVLRPRLEAPMWPLVTFAAALAVRDAIEAVTGAAADIKWPNDLMLSERKVSGILAERIDTATGAACILGIGINLTDKAFPTELSALAISLEAATDCITDGESLLAELVGAFDEHYTALHATGGGLQTLDEWTKYSSYANEKTVRVALGQEIFEGITRGLEPDGALRVETFGGTIRRVRAGDVTAVRAIKDV